ncbi:MAG: hypothetical protein NT069_15355 [Planctomycetota bacterium]|nr:hypothetical protein [Planctomycetota bacterium]
MSETFKAERDTIAGLALLAANHVRFDPPLSSGAGVSHVRGFNVHCLVIDNTDGEVLALEQNHIHAEGNPLQHAEQVGVRAALDRLRKKRPRPTDMPVEKYYKQLLFMAPGTGADDFLNFGCTLYNTFDPCGMCATTLLVCYMKRIAFLFDDQKFATVYDDMRQYFKNRDSVKEPLSTVAPAGGVATPLQDAATLIQSFRDRVHALETAGTPLVFTLDSQFDELAKATRLLMQIRPEHLTTTDGERDRNLRTLEDVRRLCNLQ